MLREQLDQATAANQSLTSDIHKLSADWQKAREELEIKENEWRDEEQVLVTIFRSLLLFIVRCHFLVTYIFIVTSTNWLLIGKKKKKKN